jgi:WhiB family transcriptional regulator, redox-sensing transcriptional regulator
MSQNHNLSPEPIEPVELLLADTTAIIGDAPIEISWHEHQALVALAAHRGVYLSARKLKDMGYLQDVRSDILSTTLKTLAEKVNTGEEVIRSIGTTYVARYALLADVELVPVSNDAVKTPPREFKVHNRDWRNTAACLEENPEDFAEAKGRAAKALIRKFCEKCVVREDCLATAIITGDKIGIKGGLPGPKRTAHIRAYKEYLKKHPGL